MIGEVGVKYRPIPSHPKYWAGDDGSVWRYDGVNKPRKRKLLQIPNRRFYVTFSRGKIAQVSRLVLEAFVGPCPEGMECCHGPGGCEDNRLSNLRWGTKESNCKDAVQFGELIPVTGEGNWKAVLTAEIVRQIMDMRGKGKTHTSIASELHLKRSTVSQVTGGRTWTHITGLNKKVAPHRKKPWN